MATTRWTWEPSQYLRFGDFRTRPAAELLARVPHETPARVADLGCGPGNSTRLLGDRWPDAEVVGIDSSEEMVERARADHPDLRFEVTEVASWDPGHLVDVVFSNALLQWIPNHVELLPRLFSFVAPGGSFAMQVPNNFDRPAHVEGYRIVREHFPDLDGILPERSLFNPLNHYEALAGEGVVVDVWTTTYLQPLTGENPVVEWMSGTFLRPLLDVLVNDPERREAFLGLYTDAMRSAYPSRADGVTLLPFPRLFAVASRVA